MRGAGAGAIGSGAGASSRNAGAGSSSKGATRSDRGELGADWGELAADRGELTAKLTAKFGELTAKFGELLVKFGELAAAPGSSSARNPAHGCCQVNRSQSAATITQAMATPTKRAVDLIAGAQSALSASRKVVFIDLGGGDHPGPLRVLAGWW